MLSRIVKAFAWGLLILLAQIVLAPLLAIKGIRPDLLLIFVISMAIRRGSYAGLAAGFVAGLAQDIISVGFIGVLALSKSTVAFWAGRFVEKQETAVGPFGWFILLFFAALVQDFIATLFLLQGSPIGLFEYLFFNVLPAALYTGVIGYLWALAPVGKRRTDRQVSVRSKRIMR